jgi:Leucine-rich repeat (LRR) protein
MNILHRKGISMIKNTWTVAPAQARVLSELERIVKNAIQVVDIRKYNLVNGIVVQDGNVTGLRLVGLTEFPEVICALGTLRTVYLDLNKIPSLPETIGNLQSLELLSLRGNALSALPDSFRNLKSLRKLLLARNQFSSVPESISNLESLQYLNFDDNQLRFIPEWVGSLPVLTHASFSGNPLQTVPDTIGRLRKMRELGSPIQRSQPYAEYA